MKNANYMTTAYICTSVTGWKYVFVMVFFFNFFNIFDILFLSPYMFV